MEQYFINNETLKSKRRSIYFKYGNFSCEFISDNGIFSKNKIDYGSKVLVDNYLKYRNNINNFLDVGCGYGFISILLSKTLNITGIGVDVNKRALKLANENAKLNKVNVNFIESNVYEKINDKYDLIITNPPIRAGKKVILDILLNAQEHLNKNGELWFVIRKDQGALSIKKELENSYQIEIIDKNKGFYVFCAKSH